MFYKKQVVDGLIELESKTIYEEVSMPRLPGMHVESHENLVTKNPSS